jgi:ribosomal protein L30/L7E
LFLGGPQDNSLGDIILPLKLASEATDDVHFLIGLESPRSVRTLPFSASSVLDLVQVVQVYLEGLCDIVRGSPAVVSVSPNSQSKTIRLLRLSKARHSLSRKRAQTS